MIGQINQSQQQVTIVGAGASGLFAAYALHKVGYAVTIHEKTERVGGIIDSLVTRYGTIETAANSLIATPELVSLCNDVDVKLVPLNKSAKAKYILRNNKMRRWPLNLAETVTLLWKASTAKAEVEGNTCDAFARHHLGSAGADYLMAALVTGIYGASPCDLSLKGCFPQLAIEKGRTLIGQKFFDTRKPRQETPRKIVIPEGGMIVLLKKIADYLANHKVKFNYSESITARSLATNTLLATSAHDAAQILAASNQKISQLLSQVVYTPMISVGVFVERGSLAKLPAGLGVLVPPCENRSVLGILFTSSSFPSRCHSENTVFLTVMIGATKKNRIFDESDALIREFVIAEIKNLFGGKPIVKEIVITRWSKAIPLYSVQHQEILDELKDLLKNEPSLVLTGSYAGDVSLRGMLHRIMDFANKNPYHY